MATVGSTLEPPVGIPDTRSMYMHGSGQVPGMAPPGSLDRFLNRQGYAQTTAERGQNQMTGLFQCLQLGRSLLACLRGHGWVCHLLDSQSVRTALDPGLSRTGADHRAASSSTTGPTLTGLPSGAWKSLSPDRSISRQNYSVTTARRDLKISNHIPLHLKKPRKGRTN